MKSKSPHLVVTFEDVTYAYSCFEKGCRKKYTRQFPKVLSVVLSLLFFKQKQQYWHKNP